MSNPSFICPVVEDSDGHLAIEFNDEILESLDLNVGDTLVWEELTNGTWALYKKGKENGNEEK